MKSRTFYVIENKNIIGTFSEGLLTDKQRKAVSRITGLRVVYKATAGEEAQV